MLLCGTDGTRLGTLERFEIDATGHMTAIVARGADAALRRITSSQVHEFGTGAVIVEMTVAEFLTLPEIETPLLQLEYNDQPRLSA
jgi:hypothetical protein